jgi:phosphohistidine phosphatase
LRLETGWPNPHRFPQNTMPRILYLLRHADAEPHSVTQPDHLRKLTEDGEHQAKTLAERLKKTPLGISAVVSSPAKRALKTLEIILKGLDITLKAQTEDKLLNATPNKILDVVSRLSDSHEAVLLVGHNPGIPGFITLVSNHSFEFLPTAGWVELTLNIDSWSEIGPGKAEMATFDLGAYAR